MYRRWIAHRSCRRECQLRFKIHNLLLQGLQFIFHDCLLFQRFAGLRSSDHGLDSINHTFLLDYIPQPYLIFLTFVANLRARKTRSAHSFLGRNALKHALAVVDVRLKCGWLVALLRVIASVPALDADLRVDLLVRTVASLRSVHDTLRKLRVLETAVR